MSADPRPEKTGTLDAFEARYGRFALFDRYARARVQQFLIRQIATGLGAVYLWFFVSSEVAVLALTITLLGETVEMVLLRRAQHWRRAGVGIQRIYFWTTLGAAVQGLSIAASIVLCIEGAQTQEAELVGLCFLMSAAVNAGFALTHHPPASRAKLTIYAACGFGFVAYEGWDYGIFTGRAVSHFLEVILLAYLTQSFVGFSLRSWKRRMANEKALMESAADLNEVNRELADRQSELRELSLVAQHANDSVILFDPEMNILWVNGAFTRQTGFTRQEALGRKPWEILGGPETDPMVADELGRVLIHKQPHHARLLNYRKDGEKVWFDINRAPVLGTDGEVQKVISVQRDVTAIEEQDQKLAKAMIRAEEGARAKSVFLATMSHEMRTPLNAIVGMADLLADSDLGQEQNEYVGTIQNASTSLLSLINDVLDFSRLEAGKVEIERTPVAPAVAIEDAARLLRTMAREKGLYLEVEADGSLPDVALTDGGRLRQILINLMGNAVKFTEVGGVRVIATAVETLGGWTLRVVVQDTGIGVPEDRADHIFGEFQQADAATTRRFGGTGLGLPISKALAQRMGGDIVILPRPGQGGSAFEVKVHLERAGAEVTLPRSETPPGPLDLATRMRVLVAEDNATNRLLVSRFLKGQPVTLLEAVNGREALEMVIDDPPDVVLMDMSMPELDGLEVTRLIRSLDIPQPYIAALTANAFESDREACAEAGMDDFVTKPLRRKHLIAALLRASRGEKPLSKSRKDSVSGPGAEKGTEPWTSPPASGTTNGKSIRSSGR